MGYASYTLPDGREAGYAVTATCDEDGCTGKIDRGLGYLCGDTPGGDEHGCGGYFCNEHLWLSIYVDSQQLCRRCLDRDVWRLPQPVPCRGEVRVPWTLPADVATEVRRQLDALAVAQ